MIQDFSNTFEGRQIVRVKALPIGGNRRAHKIIGIIATAAAVAGIASSLIFCLLIQSGLDDLAGKKERKLELMKTQQSLYAKRKEVMAEDRIIAAAAEIGLYVPDKKQVRRI